MCIRKTQWDPERAWRKGRSQGRKHGWPGVGVKPLCVKKMAAWKPARDGTVILPAYGCQGEDGNQPRLLLLVFWLRTPLEFKPYSVALWGNNMIIIATDYSTLSVCLGGTQGSSYELGSGIRWNGGPIQAPKQVLWVWRPQFPHLQNGMNYCTYFLGLWWGWNEVILKHRGLGAIRMALPGHTAAVITMCATQFPSEKEWR